MLLAATPQGDSVELTQELIDHIEDLEGFSEEAYKDVNGVLTIGFGHTNATKTFEFDENTKISRAKAEAILLADLNNAQEVVEQRLKNRNLEVNDEVKNYMILVEFNRPWVLKGTMEDIATMNADLAKQSQIDAYEEEKGTAPQWYLNRLDKEFAYLNEFDAKDEDGGDTTIAPPTPPPDDVRKVWEEILDSMLDAPTDPLPQEEPSMYTNIFGKVRELFTTSLDRQEEFTKEVYDRER